MRRFLGESDYAQLAAVLTDSEQADGTERVVSADDLAAAYAELANCDPYRDVVLAEVNGKLVGYARGWWWDEANSGPVYGVVGFLAPAWRRRGIGTDLQRWMETRTREVAATHPADLPKLFHVDVRQSQVGAARMIARLGYTAVREFLEMARPIDDGIPDLPLPAGLEVRPVLAKDYRAIWRSVGETSREGWGYTEPTEEIYGGGWRILASSLIGGSSRGIPSRER